MDKNKLKKSLTRTAKELISAIDFGKFRFVETSKIDTNVDYFDDPNDTISKVGAICTQNFLLNHEDDKGIYSYDMVATVRFDKELNPKDAYCKRRSTGHIMYELDIQKYLIEKSAKDLEVSLSSKGLNTPKKMKI